MMELTQELVKSLFSYFDGMLIRKTTVSYNAKVRDRAGWLGKRGYYYVSIRGKKYQVHRVIFLLHHGYLPEEVDHDDRDTLNNWSWNLRACSSSQNKCNSKIRRDNTSGLKGVYWENQRNKWRSRIQYQGNVTDLGFFDNLFDAACSTISARAEIHGEFANNG